MTAIQQWLRAGGLAEPGGGGGLTVLFTESFPNLAPYTLSPDSSKFVLGASELECLSTTTVYTATRSTGALALPVNRVSFEFTTPSGSNTDDGAGLTLIGSSVTLLSFIPIRETAIDVNRRPLVQINGVNTAIGPGVGSGLPRDERILAELELNNGLGTSTLVLTQLSDMSVLFSGTLNGNAGTGLVVDTLMFYLDSGTGTVPTTYHADIVLSNQA